MKDLQSLSAQSLAVWLLPLGQGNVHRLLVVEAEVYIPCLPQASGTEAGPGQKDEWSPILIGDDDEWVDSYRGLWGLDTWDPLGGERAPSGPKYERNGSVRLSWREPLSWSGLDKVPPPREAVVAMEALLAELSAEREALANRVEDQRTSVRKLELEVDALRRTEFLSDLLTQREAKLATEVESLGALRNRQNDIFR